MGGYDDNEAVTNHIWDNLVQENAEHIEHTIDPTALTREPVPQLHGDWLSPAEQQLREATNIDEEIRRRVKNQLHPSKDDNILTSPPIQDEPSLNSPEGSGSEI